MFFLNWRRLPLVLLALAATSLYGFQKKEDDDENIDRPLARWHYFYDQRESPAAEFPEGGRLRAYRLLEGMERDLKTRKSNARAAAFSGAWKSIGPQPIAYLGPSYVTSGRVTSLAVDPRSNDVVYLGGANGGVWKTTDGGATWNPITDDQPSLAIGSIAIDPSNPDVVYAGTGEENFNADAYSGVGILKSTNAGASWTNILGPFSRQRIGSLVVNPNNGNVLLAASSAGIYRSQNAGLTWNSVLTGTGSAVMFDPSSPGVAWAALGNIFGAAANGVYQSTDAGLTWTRVAGSTGAALPGGTPIGRIELTNSGTTAGAAYAVVANAIGDSGATLNGIYQTVDMGKHWSKFVAPDFCKPQCWYNLTLRQHPTDPTILLAGGVTMYRSLNAGVTWTGLPSNGSSGNTPHVDHHALQFTQDGLRFYDGNDGGAWSTQNYSGTISWRNLNQTLSLTQYYSSLSIHPTDPTISLAGAQDNGTHLYQNNVEWSRVISGDGGWTAIDPAAPNVAYAEYVDVALYKTNRLDFADIIEVDQGISQDDRVPFIASFVVDPSNPLRLYYGTYRLYRTTDGAGLWTPISGDLTDAPPMTPASNSTYTISTIAVAPTDPNVIYTGARSGSVYASSDGGAHWNEISSNLPVRAVTHITVDPVDPATVYVAYAGFSTAAEAFPGHIYKSTDGGGTWTDLTNNLPNIPLDDLVVDPDLPNTLYLATDLDVEVSTDGGASWNPLGSGLARTAVTSLVLHRPSRTLRAATHGRGVYDYTLGPADGSGPVITSLSPATKNAGDGNFTLFITGANFNSSSHVRWNGLERAITSATPNTITLTIPTNDIAAVGRAAVTVLNLSSGGGASLPANFVIGPAPLLKNNSAVSAANPSGGATASPGSVVSLYGANLAGQIEQAVAFPLPNTLGGVIVTVGGTVVPLYFVSAGQINFQVPYGVTTTGNLSLTVSQGALGSSAIALPMARVSPGLFSTNQQGTGQGAIRIANSATIAAPVGAFSDSHPVQAGDVIEIYCTGLGAVTGNPMAGAAATSSPLQTTTVQPAVTIGGKPAQVGFSGLAPGSAGLYQVNATIPTGVTAGNAAPVVLTIAGVQSNTVTIAVQ
jgi:uncharacterized protein (TIGR03437 family)